MNKNHIQNMIWKTCTMCSSFPGGKRCEGTCSAWKPHPCALECASAPRRPSQNLQVSKARHAPKMMEMETDYLYQNFVNSACMNISLAPFPPLSWYIWSFRKVYKWTIIAPSVINRATRWPSCHFVSFAGKCLESTTISFIPP